MRWEDERYVRIYTRDTPGWVYLGWEAQALFMQILRKVDRAGVMDLGKSGARGLAALLRMPDEVTAQALAALLEDGCLEQRGTTIIVPNFIEAQEASMSPSARQKESRERRRDLIRSGLDPDQRATVIYFVQSEHGGPVKVGRADDLAKRLQGLSTGRPDNLILLGAVPGTVDDERRVHAALGVYREKGEWFSPSPMVMACARAAVAGATIDDVLRHASPVTSTVTAGDAATVTGHVEPVTRHETYTVTPSLAVPSRTDLISPPVAPARPRDEGEGQGMVEVRPQAPPSPLGAAIADAQVLLAAVARHPMLVTLHGDRRWAQNASSGFMTAAVRAGDVDAAVEAFVTGEAAKAPEHPEALAAWVRDGAGGSGGIGRYLKKAKQHGDDARARAEREASRRRERPSSPRSPDAQAVLETFGPVWAAKKRRAFVPATTDERHAAEVAARARAAAQPGISWLDVVKHWAERHLASQDRIVVESDNALRTLGMQLTAYGLPKPPREKPPTPPPAEPLAGAPMPPGMLDAIGAKGPREGAMMRRPGGPS